MSEMYIVQAAGKLETSGKKTRGVLVCEDTKAVFSQKGTAVAEFVYNDMAKLQNVRTGDTSTKLTVTMKDGTVYVFDLSRSLKVYPYIEQRWQSKPVEQKSRVDELRRLA